MLVTVPVHPLSRRILNHLYVKHPIQVGKYDTLFVVLSSQRSERIANTRAKILLPEKVTFDVHGRLARHMQLRSNSVGFALLKFHKELIHQHVVSVLYENRKASAWDTIKGYLDAHGVTEDDYPMETAYKNWQRFGWDFSKKNGQKSGHLRRKTGVKSRATYVEKKGLPQYKGHGYPASPVYSPEKLDKFTKIIFDSINCKFKSLPLKFHNWLQYYIYVNVGQHSNRTAAKTLNVKKQSVERGKKNIITRCEKSPLFARLLADALKNLP